MTVPRSCRAVVAGHPMQAPLLTICPSLTRVRGTICDNYIHVPDAPDPQACHMIWGRVGPKSRETFEIVIAVELLHAGTLGVARMTGTITPRKGAFIVNRPAFLRRYVAQMVYFEIVESPTRVGNGSVRLQPSSGGIATCESHGASVEPFDAEHASDVKRKRRITA